MTLNTKAAELYGSRDIDALFKGNPSAAAPWPPAGRRKSRRDYDPDLVNEAVRSKQKPEPVDPRELHSRQPGITRAGVQHYMQSDEVYKDAHQAGNQTPVVYDREGTKMILSGHHRAARSLLRGEQFNAILVHGGWGPQR